MTKRTTEEAIKAFNDGYVPAPKRDYRFEIYKVDDKLFGYGIDDMSERRIYEGYENYWTLVRGNIRVLVATNDHMCSQEDATQFAKAYFAGTIRTYTIDLEAR